MYLPPLVKTPDKTLTHTQVCLDDAKSHQVDSQDNPAH